MKQTIAPKIRYTGLILAVITLTALLLTGCFWTPDETEGAITLNISTGGMSASAIGDFNGFFLGYVISDDLLRGDPTAAEQAFIEVESAFETALDQWLQSLMESLIEGAGSFDPTDYRVNVALPSIQMQADFFTGTSGTNTFRGLQAGRDYLVVVMAANMDEVNPVDGMGYAIVTIKAGETRSVNLALSAANYAKFDQFLWNRYGIDNTAEDEIAEDTIQLTLTYSLLPNELNPEQLYYDLIDANVSPLDFGQYIQSIEILSQPTDYVNETGDYQQQLTPLSEALNSVDLRNADGTTVSSPATETRLPIPQDGIIQDVKPGMLVQLVVVSLANRGPVDFQQLQLNPAIGISEPFTTGPQLGPLPVILYTWTTGF